MLGRTRLEDRHRDPIKLEDRPRVRIKLEDRPKINDLNDSYSGPRSSELSRTSTNTSRDLTTGRALDGGFPTTSFGNTREVNGSSWGGERLDTEAKIMDYINSRTGSLPPTAESVALLAKEINERGGNVAIATHAGGTLQSDDAIVLQNGKTYDLINSVGDPSAKWNPFAHDGTYDPSRKVVDPQTGEFETFSEFLQQRGLPVPPYIPGSDGGGGGGGGKIDNLSGWIVDADKTKKREQDQQPAQPRTYKPMPGFDTARLNDPNDKSGEMAFARWCQENGLEPSLEALEQFIKANPDWERDGDKIRLKPDAVAKHSGMEDAAEWHRAIGQIDGKPAWTFTKLDGSEPSTKEPVLAGNLALNATNRVRV